MSVMIMSSAIVFAGLLLGWFFYGRKPIVRATDPDALERLQPGIFMRWRIGCTSMNCTA
jgi:NADH-quinone oxidoreductase subunit L